MTRWLVLSLWAAGCNFGGAPFEVGVVTPDVDTFPDGPEAVMRTDTTVQTAEPSVDLLIVVDPTEGGLALARSLDEEVDGLLTYLTTPAIDLRVGVTTTDPDAGYVLDEDLAEALTFPDLEPEELPTDAMTATLEALSANGDWRRPNAALHTLVISGLAPTGLDSLAFVPSYESQVAEDTPFSFSVLAPGPAQEYRAAAEQLGGFSAFQIGDVQAVEWSLEMSGLSQTFYLSRRPEPSSIQVEVHATQQDGSVLVFPFSPDAVDAVGELLEGEYRYLDVENAIQFRRFVPEAMQQVVVTYEEAQSSP